MAQYENKLKIAAYYYICVFCSGTGMLDGERCPECHYGLHVDDQLGTIKKYLPPAAVELHERILKFVKKKLKESCTKG